VARLIGNATALILVLGARPGRIGQTRQAGAAPRSFTASQAYCLMALMMSNMGR